MPNKPRKKMLGPTLQLFDLVPITDPVELAAIDRPQQGLLDHIRWVELAAQPGIEVDSGEPSR